MRMSACKCHYFTRGRVHNSRALDVSSGINGKTDYSFKLVIKGDWIADWISESPFLFLEMRVREKWILNILILYDK
jgi:hypothetical protein